MKKGSPHWLISLLPFLGVGVLLCIGIVRAVFFTSNPLDLYNMLIAVATMACLLFAARSFHGSDS